MVTVGEPVPSAPKVLRDGVGGPVHAEFRMMSAQLRDWPLAYAITFVTRPQIVPAACIGRVDMKMRSEIF